VKKNLETGIFSFKIITCCNDKEMIKFTFSKIQFNMKNAFVFLLVIIFLQTGRSQWQPAGNKIKTIWAEQVKPENALPEYPRPQMVRNYWQNLNGLWNYAVKKKGSGFPDMYDGKILVPYAIESSLSGVQKRVGENQDLWYQRNFTIPATWINKNILLNFGAVDWRAEVWLNDIKIGSHEGGYTPFSFNITPFLTKGEQKLIVKVWDPTNSGYQPVGKQRNDPHGIWYTPVTGIWQTVWMEAVEKSWISHIKTIPDIDGNTVSITVKTEGTSPTDIIEAKIFDNGKLIGTGKAVEGQQILISVPDAKLWSPEFPFLYDLEVNILSAGKVTDKVKSYFGMRKISMSRDKGGIVRFQLNNKNYFHFGPLDQGWWPDGLYTAPTDEALLHDIKKTKEYGFNMIRKHVKVEPARWYYHCDREGVLVWQDMPNGDKIHEWQDRNYFNGKELVRSAKSEANYRQEWKEIMDHCISNPSVVVWVPFNEAWGQFKTTEIAEWTKDYDPSRLVNPASGGNHYATGDMIDIHNYPEPKMGLFDSRRANVLGEYGGIGLALENHLWEKDRNWGYVQYKSSKEVTDVYINYAKRLMELIPNGYTAAVYTQTTDVEIEVNGLMTYDRKVDKLDIEKVKLVNQEVIKTLSPDK
jgi:beta-galactosidase/beta-glucuronidase